MPTKPEHPLEGWEKAAPYTDWLEASAHVAIGGRSRHMDLFTERQRQTEEWERLWAEHEKAFPQGASEYDINCARNYRDQRMFPSDPVNEPTLAQVMAMHPTERFDFHGKDRYPDFPPSDCTQIAKQREAEEERSTAAKIPPDLPDLPGPTSGWFVRWWHRWIW